MATSVLLNGRNSRTLLANRDRIQATETRSLKQIKSRKRNEETFCENWRLPVTEQRAIVACALSSRHKAGLLAGKNVLRTNHAVTVCTFTLRFTALCNVQNMEIFSLVVK